MSRTSTKISGEKLARAIGQRGLTNKQVSIAIGRSPGFIDGLIEREATTKGVIEALRQHFFINYEDLAPEPGTPYQQTALPIGDEKAELLKQILDELRRINAWISER